MKRLNPLDYPIGWSLPPANAASRWTCNVPFAMTLIAAVQPRSFVEIGTTSGVSYRACCLAVDSVGCETRCYAIAPPDRRAVPGERSSDPWQIWRPDHDERYARFSTLMDGSVDEVRARFPDNSVDLLHLHRTGPSTVALFHRWRLALSDRAIVLLHGVNAPADEQSDARLLWQSLQVSHPTFCLPFGEGLGVVAFGARASDTLPALFDAETDDVRRMQDYFFRLGVSLEGDAVAGAAEPDERDAVIRERDEAVAWLHSELQEARRTAKLLEQRTEWYGVQLETIFSSRSWRWLARYRRMRDRFGLRAGRKLAASVHPPEPIPAVSTETPAGLQRNAPPATPGQPSAPREALTLLPELRSDELAGLVDHQLGDPVRRQIDVVCLSIIDWEFRFQRPQQMASQFAANGHRVFFVSPSRFRPAGGPVGVREIQPNLFEVELAASRQPDIYGENIGGDVAASIVDSLGELRQTYDISSAVVYVMISSWTDTALLARQRWAWPVVYDCMDEWENFQGIKGAIVEAERTLVSACDLLVVTAAKLRDKWASAERPMVLARNGVDLEFYASRYRPNPRLNGLTHPMVGYYGAIADWFDLDLMTAVAASRPQYTFVLLGGIFDVDVAALKRLPNVLMPGQQPYATMPQYLYHFDACIIPFKVNAITEATDPVKLYEYFSAGKPVVSVDLPELAPCRDLVYLARGAEHFAAQLDRALDEADPSLVEQRKAFAAANTWTARYHDIKAGIASVARPASIVIVTYNNLALTTLCLQSIFQNTDHPNYEVVLVDNASTDGTPAYLKYVASRHAHVRVILNTTNAGFARANNQGLAICRGADLVLLNNDTVVPRGWLTRLLQHLRDDAVGLVGPVSNFVGNEAKVDAPYRTWAEMEQFAAERARRYDGLVADIDMLAMFCVAARRDVLERIGPLDEQFGVGMFEDDDYAHRVHQAGLRVVCAADTFVHHVGQAAFKVLIHRGEYDSIFETNRRLYEQKWKRAWKKHVNVPLTFGPHRVTDAAPLVTGRA